ncbi:MAG: hypothetical protein QOF76_142 [Solirubrobacteraceae bacterium]|jgi:hypothetical protein|nr:hypothetical protein [Solirubrobacteraceae bacterium]
MVFMTAAPVTDVTVDGDRRVLHVTLNVDKRVAAVFGLKRSRRSLAHERALGLGPGTHAVDLRLKRLAGRGPAQLTVSFGDPTGAARTVQHIPIQIP